MLNKILMEKLIGHAGSVVLTLFFVIQYILGAHQWLDQHLPLNGKPFVIVMLIALVVLGEAVWLSFRSLHKQIATQNDSTNKSIISLQRQAKENNLIQAVNRLHDKFLVQGAGLFDDRLCVLELDTLIDIRKETNTNSFTQRKLEDMSKSLQKN